MITRDDIFTKIEGNLEALYSYRDKSVETLGRVLKPKEVAALNKAIEAWEHFEAAVRTDLGTFGS